MTDETEPVGGVDTLPPPTVPPRPVFRRSAEERVLSGVAGGLGRTFAVDPVIVRVIVVVLAVTFPPAFVVYLVAWLLVARDGEQSSTTIANTALRRTDGVGFWVGVGMLAITTVAVLDDPFRADFSLLPLILIGIGVALWTRDGREDAAGSTSPPPVRTSPSGSSSPAAVTRAPVQQPTSWPPAQTQSTAPPVETPRAPRPRSPLGAATLALALIATGVVAALDQVDSVPIDADPTHLAAVALLVLGVGLLVGAFWGRARWLTLVALLLLPVVLVGAGLRAVTERFDLGTGVELGDGIGERDVEVSGAQLPPVAVRLLAGSARVDLEDWSPDAAVRRDVDASDQDLVVEVGAGEVLLTPPTDVAWRIVGSVGLGEVLVRDADGLVLDQRSTEVPGSRTDIDLAGGPPGGPVYDIVVRVELGQLTVHDLGPTTTEDLT